MFVDHWLVFDACMKSGMCVTPINEHQVKNASLLLNAKTNVIDRYRMYLKPFLQRQFENPFLTDGLLVKPGLVLAFLFIIWFII
jgi:hypothetical protein